MSPGWRFPERLSYRKMPIFSICFTAAAITVTDLTPSRHPALRLTLRHLRLVGASFNMSACGLDQCFTQESSSQYLIHVL